jgi:hypothetical protein
MQRHRPQSASIAAPPPVMPEGPCLHRPHYHCSRLYNRRNLETDCLRLAFEQIRALQDFPESDVGVLHDDVF